MRTVTAMSRCVRTLHWFVLWRLAHLDRAAANEFRILMLFRGLEKRRENEEGNQESDDAQEETKEDGGE